MEKLCWMPMVHVLQYVSISGLIGLHQSCMFNVVIRTLTAVSTAVHHGVCPIEQVMRQKTEVLALKLDPSIRQASSLMPDSQIIQAVS